VVKILRRARASSSWLLHKDGFGEIHFARNSQHGVIGEAIAIGYYGERIAAKRLVVKTSRV